MDFKEIMEIIKTFLNAIITVLQALGLNFGNLLGGEDETTTTAQ